MTVFALKQILKNYPDDTIVLVDTNNLNGGSFENLIFNADNESPLTAPNSIYFHLEKDY